MAAYAVSAVWGSHPTVSVPAVYTNVDDCFVAGALMDSPDRLLLVKEPPDGSCFFHAVARQLGDGSTAAAVCAEVCATVRAHPGVYAAMKDAGDPATVDGYIDGDSATGWPGLSNAGCYGGALDAVFVMLRYRRHVVVYEYDSVLATSAATSYPLLAKWYDVDIPDEVLTVLALVLAEDAANAAVPIRLVMSASRYHVDSALLASGEVIHALMVL